MINQKISPLTRVVSNAMKQKKVNEAKQFLQLASSCSYELDVLDEIAYLQNELKDYKASTDTLKKCSAVAASPQEKYAIRANLAKVFNHMNDPYMSMGYSNANLSLYPDDYDTLLEIAFSHYLGGDYKNSEKIMREISNKDNVPENVMNRVLYNLGSYDLERKKFKQGLKGFIGVGHKIGIWKISDIPHIETIYNSISEVGDRTLIVRAEGGIGDEIINIRFLHNLDKLNINTIWLTHSEDIANLFKRNGYNATTKLPDDLSNCVQTPAMFLPIILDLNYNELWNGPYLQPDEDYIEKWEKILPHGKKMVIKWTGNPAYEQNLHRSIPVEFMKNLQFNGTKINIQLEPHLFIDDVDDVFNVGYKIESLEDTLAILSICDTFVSSCTCIAHLGAAMGKAGCVCPPIASYYTWLGNSEWYDLSLKVFRQTKLKKWDDVFNKVQGYLNDNKF